MKKYVKMNKNNYLSLGNLFNIIKKNALNKDSAMQIEIFCALFNINDINYTTVNNYCIGYRPIGIEYKKIYLELKEEYISDKDVYIDIMLNILNILDEKIYIKDNNSINLINNNKRLYNVINELLEIAKLDKNINDEYIENNYSLLKENNLYEVFINLLLYIILDNKQPIYIEEFDIELDEELKDYLKINLYEGISYISSLKELAKKDNKYACAELGSLEFSGLINGYVDYNKSYNYYMKASLKNHPKACWMIANLIFTKRVEYDEEVMLIFLKKAIDLGSVAALNTYGLYLLKDNVEEALKYFERASLSGYAYAYNNIGLIHERNNNYKEALKYFKLSADLNQSWALNKVGEYYRKNNNLEEAYFYYNKSIECPINERNYYGYYNLAKYYYIKDNKNKAIEYLKIACDNNIKEARILLKEITKE